MADRITLSVVINGNTTVLEFEAQQPLHSVIAEALGKTGNTGRPPGDWIPTNEAGDRLDSSKTLSALGIGTGFRLFLTTSAGAGG